MSDYSYKINRLYDLQNTGIKLGLEHTIELLNALDNPEQSLKFIHVAGTNGKGSVCSILATALRGAGYKVGFYSSPHLVSLRERFRINGRGISEKELEELIDLVWPVVEKLYSEDKKVTFFEVTVSMAALYFARKKCDFVLWETGMGGRLDSTNVVLPVISAITGIGMDHEKFLGDTEEKIAFEKAGIIKPQVPVFVGKLSSSAFKVIEDVAFSKSAPIFPVKKNNLSFSKFGVLEGWNFFVKDMPKEDNSNCTPEYSCFGKHRVLFEAKQKQETSKNGLVSTYCLPLSGNAQPDNMELAYLILKYLSQKYNFSLDTALKSIASLKWHGRIQLLPDGKVLDGSHNPQGTASLIRTLKTSFKNQKFIVVFGCLEEREPQTVISILSQIAKEFIFVPINSTRKSYPVEDCIAIAKNIAPEITCSTAMSLKKVFKDINKNEKVLITGSLYLAGETLLEYYTEKEIVDI